jgi:hypothetical protein
MAGAGIPPYNIPIEGKISSRKVELPNATKINSNTPKKGKFKDSAP